MVLIQQARRMESGGLTARRGFILPPCIINRCVTQPWIMPRYLICTEYLLSKRRSVMVDKQQLSALIATFADRRQAEHYVNELKSAGFKEDEVGVLSPPQHLEDTPVEDEVL